MTRWFQQTALSTVMQVGNSASTVPWEVDPDTGYDDELLSWYRGYARLHLRLFPYLWGYAEALATSGRPIQRALGLAHPELGVHPSDEYLLGDFLLVAPVVTRGERERALHLPPGEWIDVWTGERLVGPGPTTVAAPLERIPLFLKAGGLVPRLRPTIDTLSPVADPAAIDSYATRRGDLWVWTAPGPVGLETTLDGMGASRFVSRATDASLELELELGATGAEGVVLEVLAWGGPPEAVSADGVELAELTSEDEVEAGAVGWLWVDELGGRLLVRVDAGAQLVALTR
jgi:alpha-D-xyloside xylohydrolase